MNRKECQEALDFLNDECEIITNQPYKQDAEDLFEMKKESIELLQMLIDEYFKISTI